MSEHLIQSKPVEMSRDDGIRQEELVRVMDLIRRLAGMPTEAYSYPALRRAIQRRMLKVGIDRATEYLRRIEMSAHRIDELTELASLLVIQKTSFFRDRFHFDLLIDKVIPQLRSASRPFYVWSAGCSTGEEPYSLAIAMRAAGLTESTSSVLATDLSRSSLRGAEQALYSSDKLTELTTTERSYFVPISDDLWRCSSSLQCMLSFERHNLLSLPYPKPEEAQWDVVFCRNVLIYFDRDTVHEVIRRFHRVLRPGGYLFLGSSESLFKMSDGYELFNSGKAYVYRRLEDGVKARSSVVRLFQSESQATADRQAFPELETQGKPEPGPGAGFDDKPQEEASIETMLSAQQDKAGEHPTDLQSTEVLLAFAQCAADNGSLEEAQSWLCAALEKDPFHIQARFLLAVVLQRLEQFEESAAELRRLLFLNNGFSMAHYYLGMVAEKAGRK